MQMSRPVSPFPIRSALAWTTPWIVGFLSVVPTCLAARATARATQVPSAAAAAASELLPTEAEALEAAGVEWASLNCSTSNRWSVALRPEAALTARKILNDVDRLGGQVLGEARAELTKGITDAVFWTLVLSGLVDGGLQNLGAAAVTLPGERGQPVAVLRSAFTAAPEEPGSCVQSLLGAGVRHIVNLYAGPMPTDELAAKEKRAVEAVGGTYYDARDDPQAGHFREELRAGDSAEKRAAMQAVAQIIRGQILRPGGRAPRGHVQVHCGGGMHRTGMVIGVLERCSGRSLDDIEQRFKRHVGWRSATQPGGFEPANLAFIAEFDCDLLR